MRTLARPFPDRVVEGRPQPQPADLVAADARIVTPDYFAVMSIPLRRGRLLGAGDVHGGMPAPLTQTPLSIGR